MAAVGTSLLLAATIWAQNVQVPKVRIFFTDGDFEKASMTYGLHEFTDGYYRHYGVSIAPGASFFEIAAVPPDGHLVDRFKALVWAPGCKMKQFDVTVGISDTDLQFACDALRRVPFIGRVKSGNQSGSATISAEYTSMATCLWMDACTNRCSFHCGGPQIVYIATADVAADGTFQMELPDFSADPIASDDPSAGLEFRFNYTLLKPESTRIKALPV